MIGKRYLEIKLVSLYITISWISLGWLLPSKAMVELRLLWRELGNGNYTKIPHYKLVGFFCLLCFFGYFAVFLMFFLVLNTGYYLKKSQQMLLLRLGKPTFLFTRYENFFLFDKLVPFILVFFVSLCSVLVSVFLGNFVCTKDLWCDSLIQVKNCIWVSWKP